MQTAGILAGRFVSGIAPDCPSVTMLPAAVGIAQHRNRADRIERKEFGAALARERRKEFGATLARERRAS